MITAGIICIIYNHLSRYGKSVDIICRPYRCIRIFIRLCFNALSICFVRLISSCCWPPINSSTVVCNQFPLVYFLCRLILFSLVALSVRLRSHSLWWLLTFPWPWNSLGIRGNLLKHNSYGIILMIGSKKQRLQIKRISSVDYAVRFAFSARRELLLEI